jgi:signal transduction histidine kinase
VVIIYAVTEPLLYLDFATYVNRVLFFTAILISAAIGAYVTEHNQRANFLRKRTLDIHHEKTLHSIKQKNKYLAAASHDIRQPLQGIALMAEVLKQSQPDSVHVQHLNKGIQTLNSMFTQMLDISKVNLDLIQPKLDNFSLLDLIEQNTQGFITRLQQENIQLSVDLEDCHIRSDFTMLSRVLHNLLENALNHSKCSKISICNKIINNEVKLTIIDNGGGISETMQTSIFNEFIKGEDSQDGLGLGLAIVSQFCKKLVHPLEFTSEVGHTQFSISIPRAIDSLEIKNTEDKKEKILLIDDDHDVLASLTDMLDKWGYSVTSASGIQHAMNLIKKDWHCIISDWNLADGCGEEILQYAYQHKIPSILISTHGGSAITNCAKEYDSSFLKKPISPSRLRAKLINII